MCNERLKDDPLLAEEKLAVKVLKKFYLHFVVFLKSEINVALPV